MKPLKKDHPFMIILARECRTNNAGKFETKDVLRLARRTFDEQQEIIAMYEKLLSERKR